MSKYELPFVVNAKIEDDERAAVVDKCKALIERFGGTITNVDEWGKRRLAYEIQQMKEGFYYIVQFDAPTTAPAERDVYKRQVYQSENIGKQVAGIFEGIEEVQPEQESGSAEAEQSEKTHSVKGTGERKVTILSCCLLYTSPVSIKSTPQIVLSARRGSSPDRSSGMLPRR